MATDALAPCVTRASAAMIFTVRCHRLQWGGILSPCVILMWRNRPISQVPQCTWQISHNATFCNRNVHTCAHFCYKMVHCGIWDWCIIRFVWQVYYRKCTCALFKYIIIQIDLDSKWLILTNIIMIFFWLWSCIVQGDITTWPEGIYS